MAHADDEAAADEEVGLAEGDAAVDQLGGARDDEQRVAVLLELRPGVRVLGVLDREVVQAELALHPEQQVAARLQQADPDDVAVLAGPAGGAVDRDVADPAPVEVDARGDDPRFGACRLSKLRECSIPTRRAASLRRRLARRPVAGKPAVSAVSRPSRWIRKPSAAASAAIGQRPRPAARPIAAASHMPAPVVRFFTSPRDSTIIPAARKATPAVAASTRRIGSSGSPRARSACISIRCRVISAKAEAAIPTSMWVRSPAARSLGLALEADHRAERRRADQAGDDDRQRQDEAAQELFGQHRPGTRAARPAVPSAGRSVVVWRGAAAEGRAMRTMRIVALGRPLGPAEVPVPVPGPGEVLLRVHACGLNFADTLMAAGRYQEKPALPFAPGPRGLRHASRRSARASPAPARGTRVAGLCGAGGLAEFVALPAAACAPVPDGDGRRGGGRLPRRLRHQPRRARAARAGSGPARRCWSPAPRAASG